MSTTLTLKTAVLGLVLGLGALPGSAAEKTRIMTTVLPLKEFATAVAGERGEVDILLPPGAGVHTWHFRPGDFLRLQACDLFIFVGADLEPWIAGLLKTEPLRSKEILEASRGLPLLEADALGYEGHNHETYDPHIWLDFELDLRIVDKIEAVLVRRDPGGREDYGRNAEILRGRLRDLDARFRSGLEGCRTKDLVIAGHGAFAYLARRYGLTQKSVYGLSPDAQPSPRRLMELIEYCRKENVRTVFFENSVPQDAARVLADEIGGRIMALNTGHNLTADQMKKGLGFFDLMEENLNRLKEGLSGR